MSEEEAIRELAKLSKRNKILGSPTRLSIMTLLFFKTRIKFTELQKILDLTPGNLSSHLQKLEKAGYVKIIKGFMNLRPVTIIQITPNGAQAIREYMITLRKILETGKI